MLDYVRISCCVPDIKVGDTVYNTERIKELYQKAADEGSDIVLFPELCVCGYTCADLFFQKSLINGCLSALSSLCEITAENDAVMVAGAPLVIDGRLYNCAVVMSGGGVDGIVPKSILPDFGGFSEKRWFYSASDLKTDNTDLCGTTVPVGNDLIFTVCDTAFGIEIGEDLWAPSSPAASLCTGGAEIMLNLSATNEAVGKKDFIHSLIKSSSSKNLCAYAYCSAGNSESTTDLVFSGMSLISERGKTVCENQRSIDNDYIITSDIDTGRIRADRMRSTIFGNYCSMHSSTFRKIAVSKTLMQSNGEYYSISPMPFVPESRIERTERCLSIFRMQVAGLKKRMSVAGERLVIGISGGLDSTLALLVCAEAVRQRGQALSDVTGITMPAFGTSNRTYNNSLELMHTIGVTAKEISIKDSCLQHMKDIGHDPSVHDVTFENTQARERTQVLMDMANKLGAIVVGTGDLSEMALGWCTYNGDHMSMYGVNAGVPKTLIRWIIEAIIESNIFPESRAVLEDILDTPISPELLPPDEEGKIAQKTEDVVGPYALHDFFLYYVLRFGFTPSKIFALASRTFSDSYDDETILKWLKTFYRRFFTQQFKRSCMPDGVKIGSVGLSPRGDFKMPSDASYKIWLDEVEKL